ncbi:hypothetical protein WJX72_000361 [[Myrmecia] bisecta]|uniref:G domain-containing protein n=1 Tax=[Myrmecia] bisecta TaxID=41462 RepID=A0AAW1Q1A8_9CHLO
MGQVAGCGVKLQLEDPDAPGYLRVPKRVLEQLQEGADKAEEAWEEPSAADLAAMGFGDGEVAKDAAEDMDDDAFSRGAGYGDTDNADASTSGRTEAILDLFGDSVEGWLGEGGRRPPLQLEEVKEDDSMPGVLCARCYSLKHYGQIKSQKAETLLPEFDLGKRVGRKIQLQRSRRAVILCVIDIADFDGSLPRSALRSLLPATHLEDGGVSVPAGYRLVLAVNKADLLPPQVTTARLQQWVRKRAKQGGLPRPSSVHLVSSLKSTGIKDLIRDLHQEVGERGDVWVVGAQNAGKSSLINAMRRAVGRHSERNELTTAPVPGTTLGLLRVDGLMPPRCKMFDTPGVPHSYQLSSRLSPEEVRMLLPRRRLRPRTFRAGAGQTVLIGGIARIDVLKAPAATLYLTLWASDDINCHFGRTDTADDRYAKAVGTLLTPPIGDQRRIKQLGALVPTEVDVEGSTFHAHTQAGQVGKLPATGLRYARLRKQIR